MLQIRKSELYNNIYYTIKQTIENTLQLSMLPLLLKQTNKYTHVKPLYSSI